MVGQVLECLRSSGSSAASGDVRSCLPPKSGSHLYGPGNLRFVGRRCRPPTCVEPATGNFSLVVWLAGLHRAAHLRGTASADGGFRSGRRDVADSSLQRWAISIRAAPRERRERIKRLQTIAPQTSSSSQKPRIFLSKKGRPVSYGAAIDAFHSLKKQLCWEQSPTPRPYDLRHTLAVKRLITWQRRKDDAVGRKILALAT